MTQEITVSDASKQTVHVPQRSVRSNYVVDTRPLCQGMPFILTDAAHPRLVLKHGSHFLVLEETGNIPACNSLGYGYYRYDTRHLSQWEYVLNDIPLSLLSSAIEEGYAGSFLYTNAQTDHIAQQQITVHREIVLHELLWERVTIQNFSKKPIDCDLKIQFQSDFADMFEVRGLNRPHRGVRMVPVVGPDGKSLYLAYQGSDGALLETIVELIGVTPDHFEDGQAHVKLHLPVRQARQFEICISTMWDGHTSALDDSKIGYSEARKLAELRYKNWLSRSASIFTDHEFFDHCLKRNYRDLYILRQPTPKGFGLAAGIPWYSAVFGRDSAITAWQILPFLPEVSKECVQVLAAYQGTKEDRFRAEAPGKICHELRLGELARTNEIPHSPYYGTVDATQLWLILLADYVDWTGDLELAHQLWPNIKLAMQYLDTETEATGYVCYKRESEKGLENQGWKDSGDSVMHTDGHLARPPIAICEAQAYLYLAKTKIAKLAELIGHPRDAARLRQEAAQLKSNFMRDFWMPKEDFVALALDGDGRQVGVISSNPGHCLFTGILDDDKANLVADRLMSRDMHSGWGIRTLSEATSAFNPISYHNGSVWPHDNSIIAEGMRTLGRMQDAHNLMKSMFEVAQNEAVMRLPELFCGFERNEAYRQIDYPVSCSPQAWAAGAMFQMLKACINFQPDALNGRLKIVEPNLPDWLGRVTIRGVRIGGAMIDLSFSSQGDSSSCHILKKSGNVRVIVEN